MVRPSLEIPYLPPANNALILDLLATINNSLDAALLPSTVPPDVLRFQNPQNFADVSFDVCSGSNSSPKIPGGGGEINIATLFAFLDSSTIAPHLLLELIQGGPASIVLLMDLLPRKDLVLHLDYLDKFYQKTDLDDPSVLTPTTVAVSIECGKEGETEAVMEEIVAVRIATVTKKIVRVWLEKCVGDEGRLVWDGEIGGVVEKG